MNRLKKIDALKSRVKVLKVKNADKIVIFSDCHRGDGSFRDSLYPNTNIYITALRYYYNEGFTYVEAGDGDELWKFKSLDDIFFAHEDDYKILNQFKKDDRFYMIYGNHDNDKGKKNFKKKVLKLKNQFLKDFYKDLEIHEGLILDFEGKKDFLVFHGHQVDYLNCEFSFLAKCLVRYVWGFMNGVLSFNEISSPAKSNNSRERIDNRIYEWCKDNNSSAIIGHTHKTIFPNASDAQYFNLGACVLPYTITCIEIQNGTITLVKWIIKSVEWGMLAVKKELVALPRII